MNAREFGDQLLQQLLHHLRDSVPDAVGAGLSLLAEQRPRSVCGIGVAAALDPMQWTSGEGPLVDAVHDQLTGHRTTLVLPGRDGGFDPARWPALAAETVGESVPWPVGVVVAVQEWRDGQPMVLSLYTDTVPGNGPLAGLDRFWDLLTSAVAVVEHGAGEELRAQQMLQMVQYRRVIEQAKGLVMGAVGADGEAAFATLARASQHFNIRLRNLAIALVEHVGGAPAEGPEDPDQVVVLSPADRRVAVQVWAALTRPSPQQSSPA